jgi:hypothetical protein
MSHLTIETLARLIDEPPDSAESAHLELCDECRAELEGLKADASALAALPQLEPPSAQWYALEQQLVSEGLLRKSAERVHPRWLKPALQAAAAIVIFVIGNLTAPLFFKTSDRIAMQPEVDRPVIDRPLQAPTSVSTAAGQAVFIDRLPRTRDEAETFVRNTERSYLSALTRYAELDEGTQTSDLVAQLAALESIVLTTRAALGQAPADPVINGYHLTALAQREAALKKLAAARGQTWF